MRRHLFVTQVGLLAARACSDAIESPLHHRARAGRGHDVFLAGLPGHKPAMTVEKWLNMVTVARQATDDVSAHAFRRVHPTFRTKTTAIR